MCNTLCTSGFVDDVMFSDIGLMHDLMCGVKFRLSTNNVLYMRTRLEAKSAVPDCLVRDL